MSVINAMLKKLDERGIPLPPGGAALNPLPPSALQPASAARWRLPAIVLIGGAAVAFTALADWPQLVRPAKQAHAPAASAASLNAETAVSEPTAASAIATAAAPASAASPGGALPSVAVAAPAMRAAAEPRSQPARTAGSASGIALPPSLATPAPLPARIDKRLVATNAEQRVLALYRGATALAQSGQSRAALERAHEALAIDAQHAPTRFLAAVLEHESGASERAAQLLRDGLAANPRNAAQALLLARILVAQGDAAEAMATLDRHGVMGPDADGLRGGILVQQGDFKRSLDAYESAARQQPANAMWWLGLGVALDSEGHGQRARQAYARAQAIGLPRDDLVSYVDQRLRALD